VSFKSSIYKIHEMHSDGGRPSNIVSGTESHNQWWERACHECDWWMEFMWFNPALVIFVLVLFERIWWDTALCSCVCFSWITLSSRWTVMQRVKPAEWVQRYCIYLACSFALFVYSRLFVQYFPWLSAFKEGLVYKCPTF